MQGKLDFRKIKKGEITRFAKRLARFHSLIYDAICMAEDLLAEPYIDQFTDYDEDCIEFLKRLASAFKSIDKHNEDFITIETYNAYFQEMDSFTMALNEVMEEAE